MLQQQQQQQQAGTSRGGAPSQAEEQQQFVIALTQQDWEDMTSIVRKEDCRMRHRCVDVDVCVCV